MFVDGGTTAYNNPAFLLYSMVTEPAYKLQWPKGERNLLIASIGTGPCRCGPDGRRPRAERRGRGQARRSSALMNQAAFDQDLSCRTIGRCVAGPWLDNEVGDLDHTPTDSPCRRRRIWAVRSCTRATTRRSPEGLDAIDCADINPDDVSLLDSVAHMAALERVGGGVATRHVDISAFGPFLDA